MSFSECICGFLFALLSTPAWLNANPLQSKQIQDVAFAFSDSTGTKFLSVDTTDKPTRLSKAICSQGPLLNIRFLGLQKKSSDWNGRQTAYNFDKTEGALFSILGERLSVKAASGESCLLVTEQFLSARRRLPVTVLDVPTPISVGLLRRIEQVRKKKALWGKLIGKIDRNSLVVVQFAPESRKSIASLVFLGPDFTSFNDHEANYDENAKDFVWRVDVPGVNPADFYIVAAFEGGMGAEIVVLWDGYEGQNLFLLRRNGVVLRSLYHSYRYWAGQ